jgi:hypothetical protein
MVDGVAQLAWKRQEAGRVGLVFFERERAEADLAELSA